MSFWARILQRFRNSTGFVGRDLEGNRFFEHPSISDDPRRTKRVVKYAQGTHMLDYVSGNRRLAAQWTSWMTHTRPHPPTLEELQADLERQRRVQLNVAMIEARDREEAAQIVTSTQTPLSHVQAPTSRISQNSATSSVGCQASSIPTSGQRQDIEPRNGAQSSQSRPQQVTDNASPWKLPASDEPHSWQPRASVRRGG